MWSQSTTRVTVWRVKPMGTPILTSPGTTRRPSQGWTGPEFVIEESMIRDKLHSLTCTASNSFGSANVTIQFAVQKGNLSSLIGVNYYYQLISMLLSYQWILLSSVKLHSLHMTLVKGFMRNHPATANCQRGADGTWRNVGDCEYIENASLSLRNVTLELLRESKC